VAFLAGAAASLVASPAFGQTAPASNEEAVKLEKFIVTGSNIPSTETTAEARTFPVHTIDRRLIEQSGLFNTTELLQKMVLSNGGSVPFTNNATGFTPGGTSVSLRGLGPDSTLVLLNGKRVASYPKGQGGTTAFVDLNTIPVSAIERIEVLKDGASAVYGADAVAGVVNVIFRRGFDGAEATFTYGNTTNKDSSEFSANLVVGMASEKGNITIGANFQNREPIFNRDRSYSAVPPFLSSNASPANFQVSRAAVEAALGLAPGSAITINGAANTTTGTFFATTGRANSVTLEPLPGNQNANNNGNLPASAYYFSSGRSSFFNYNEFSGSYPEMTRNGGFIVWDRKLADKVTAYGDIMFQQHHQIDELAPYATGNFVSTGQKTVVIPARTPNPILTPAEVAAGLGRTAAIGAFNPFNPFNQDISGSSRIRLAEFGNRVYHTRNTAMSFTGGLQFSDLADKYNLDMSARHSSLNHQTNNRLIHTGRFLQILNAADPIYNPASGDYIGTTVPYNPFGYFRNPIASNTAPVAFARHFEHGEYLSRHQQLNATLNSASLFELPAGDVGFALGVDFYRESTHQAPDSSTQSGDLLAQAPEPVTIAQRKILAYFTELEVPLISEKNAMDGAHRLSLNLAGRYENFLTSDRTTFVPKVGLRWEPLSDGTLVFRGSWGKGFREPSLYELYASNSTGLVPIDDPVSGVSEPEQNTGIKGNPLLKPETSKSINVGVVWSPKGKLDGFTASVDYWNIKRVGKVDVNEQNVLDRSILGRLLPGERVDRDFANNLVYIQAIHRNVGQTNVDGFDVATSYVWKTTSWGRFDTGFNASYMANYKESDIEGSPLEQLIDTAISSADDAYLRIKAQAWLGWNWKDASARVTANYTHGFDDFGGDPNTGIPFRVDATTFFDLQLSYKLFSAKSSADRRWWSDMKVTAGANNLFDKNPPFAADGGNNSNGYPGFLYTDVGRFIYFGLEKKL